MTTTDTSTSNGAGDFRAGDVVRLRVAHQLSGAGTRGRIIGFYVKGQREALLSLEDGDEVSVPCTKLERVP
jgi:hypothetical protein